MFLIGCTRRRPHDPRGHVEMHMRIFEPSIMKMTVDAQTCVHQPSMSRDDLDLFIGFKKYKNKLALFASFLLCRMPLLSMFYPCMVYASWHPRPCDHVIMSLAVRSVRHSLFLGGFAKSHLLRF